MKSAGRLVAEMRAAKSQSAVFRVFFFSWMDEPGMTRAATISSTGGC